MNIIMLQALGCKKWSGIIIDFQEGNIQVFMLWGGGGGDLLLFDAFWFIIKGLSSFKGWWNT